MRPACIVAVVGMTCLAALGQDDPPPSTPPTDPPPAQGEDDPDDAETGAAADKPDESASDIETSLDESAKAAEAMQDDEATKPEPTPEETAETEQITAAQTEAPSLESADDIGGQIAEVKEANEREGMARAIDGFLEHGPIDRLYDAWQPWHDKVSDWIGLDLGLAYTTLAQVASHGDGQRDASSGDFDVVGRWRALTEGEGDDRKTIGSLNFHVEQRHRFGKIPPSDLGDELGSQWRTTRGFTVQSVAVVQLFWEHLLFDDHLKVTVGKLNPRNYYNGNRFQNQNRTFINSAFSDNPARAFPANGLGFNARIVPDPSYYISAGVQQSNSTKTSAGFDKLNANKLFYAVEIGLTPPRFEKLGHGRFRFTYWYTNGTADESSTDRSGGGWALSLDQDLGNGIVPFVRWGYTDSELTNTRQIVSGGIGVPDPFDRKGDLFGAAFAWGQAADRSLRDQYVFETFYRLQWSPMFSVTPGYQLIFDPSENQEQDVIGVFELRMRILF